MEIDKQFNHIARYASYALLIRKFIDGNKGIMSESSEALNYLNVLSEIDVTKLSKFKDPVWDYNDNYPNASVNVKGAKLKMNFGSTGLPESIVMEVKCIFHMFLLNPSAFMTKTGLKNKANTVIVRFTDGLRFYSCLYEVLKQEYGDEYVNEKITSIASFTLDDHRKAARVYKYCYGPTLRKFIDLMSDKAVKESILTFKGPVVEADSLEWAKFRASNKGDKIKRFTDDVFEKLVVASSSIVSDFLSSMNEVVIDESAAKYNTFKGVNYCSKIKLDRDAFYHYVALRLLSKGHPIDLVRSYEIPDYVLNEMASTRSGLTESTVRDSFDARYKRNEFRLHLNKVSYAALFLVGQFTGMRSSELAEIVVRDSICLIKEKGFWLIKSDVKKHKENFCGLFDDKWLAIPIVRDAIKAASLITKYTMNDYLVSNSDTCRHGETGKPMQSGGIKHQMDNYFSHVLGEGGEKIGFSSKMFRHTLAYQLYKADLGLPFISFQLKHFVNTFDKFTSVGSVSDVTLGYGDIGDFLCHGDIGRGKGKSSIRKDAEVESVKGSMNPEGTYIGAKAGEHKERLANTFKGYIAAGYDLNEIYEAMADQGIGIINVGQGFCYGGVEDEADADLPCIGSLRCNPVRCKNAFISKANIHKWREIYIQNAVNIDKPAFQDNREQMLLVMEEAKMVLEHLGVSLVI